MDAIVERALWLVMSPVRYARGLRLCGTALREVPIVEPTPGPPIQVNCLGTAQVIASGRMLWPSSELGNEQRACELLFLLAASHPDGVDRDAIVVALWHEADLADVARSLRQLRRRLRNMLARAVDGLPDSAPLEADTGRVYRLNRKVIVSDVHQFLELKRQAKANSENRLDLLERAFGTYAGDVFDSAAAPPFSWAIEAGDYGTSLAECSQTCTRQVVPIPM